MAENEGVLYSVVGGAHMNYEALPNIIMTRYEGNKKGGFAAIDDNGQISVDVLPDEATFAIIHALKDTKDNG